MPATLFTSWRSVSSEEHDWEHTDLFREVQLNNDPLPEPVSSGYDQSPESGRFEVSTSGIGSLSPSDIQRIEVNFADAMLRLSDGVLGENGAKRLASFKKYPDGWDGGNGKKFSEISESRMRQFVSEYCLSRGVSPSVFLTQNGNAQLVWRDEFGGAIEIEFFDDRVGFFLETNDSEGEIPYDHLGAILP